MLRAVLDVNLLVSAALSRGGPPGRVVAEWFAGRFELVVSPALEAELGRVLARRRVADRLDARDLELLRAALLASALRVEDPPAARRVPGDPKDDYLVALALAAGAHVIVTGDRNLLDADLGDGPPRVLAPAAFLALLERLGA